MPSPLVKKLVTIIFLSIVVIITIQSFVKKNKKETIPVTATTTSQLPALQKSVTIIGHSVQGRAIEAYRYGSGSNHIVFVGGIHGGYEWNSVLLAYEIIDYFNNNGLIIPKNVTVDIIPSLNPDALYKVTGKDGRFNRENVVIDKKILAEARFNANKVDLNRNFDCKWQSKSSWQSNIVSAGAGVFSEPETKALQEFILNTKPSSVVFWHSQGNGIYASQCEKGILETTRTIMNTYSQASGYPAVETFNAYVVTGAAEDWLASIGIPAITVELQTHETVELEKNLAGVKALINQFK